MGATRGRLIRQLLTESLLLSGLGGLLGVLVGYWSRGLLPFGQTAPLDWRVFGFVTGVSVLTGVIFGLMPALRATRVDLASAMKESSRSVTGSRTILSKGLLVLQVAMSLVLLIGAGLFIRTLENLKRVDVGFDSTNLLMFNLNPGVNRYDPDRSAALLRQALERFSALPGVKSAGLTRNTLLSGNTSTSSVWKQGQTDEKATEDNMYMMDVSPTFFATMGIPVQIGRVLSDHDDQVAPKVAMINEAAARRLFPDGNAIGRHIGFSFEKAGEFEVVGVVRDAKYASVRDPGPPTMYRCLFQAPLRSSSVVLRTQGDPMAMSETVRAAMREIDPTLPIQRFTSQTEQISQRFAQERLFATAYTAFGGLALVLACIGLFGLMSYNVSRRTNEIGIRMALGAQRGTVVAMVMVESLLLVGIGVALGLSAAIWAGRFVKTVLYGLSATDTMTIAGAVILITVVSALAGYLPARRASRVDPMVALHQQ
jgi:predicted permease